jgi:type III restriction enzyme
VAAVPRRDREPLERELERHQVRALTASAPSERGEAFAPLPQLVVPLQGELLLYEPELLAEFADFSLSGLPAELPDFQRQESVRPYLIDVERGHMQVREDEAQYVLDIDAGSEGIRREDLLRFWLPTSTDRFYPDFVAELEDGRLLAVEYKGGDRYSNDDSREKRDIGAVWAAASGGRCLFAMVTDLATAGASVVAQLRRAVDVP